MRKIPSSKPADGRADARPDVAASISKSQVGRPGATLLALARLLGRQAAREAIRAERDDAQIPDPAPATPATTTDEK